MVTRKSKAATLLLASAMLSGLHADQPVRKKSDDCNMAGCNVVPKGCPVLCTSYLDINCNNLMFDVGILLEQFKLTGTQFAFTSVGNAPFNSALPRNAFPLKAHFKLQWGVTVAAGYYFSHDDFLLKARFDWLRSSGSKSAEAEYGQYIVPTYIWESGMQPTSAPITNFEKVDSHISVDYYNLDIDLNRGSFFSNCITLEPHIGIKSTWINYKHSINYDTENNTITTPADVSRKISSKFWGMGPAFGFNTVWNLIDDVGLFFDNNLAILFGKSKVKDDVSNVFNTDNLATHASSAPTVVSPALRAIFGIQWERTCFQNTQHLAFRIGADTAVYWNQYQHIDVSNEFVTTTGSDPKFLEKNNDILGMIGLILEVKWDF